MKIAITYDYLLDRLTHLNREVTLLADIDPSTQMVTIKLSLEMMQDLISIAQSKGINVKVTE